MRLPSNLVVGGIGTPRFLLVGEELSKVYIADAESLSSFTNGENFSFSSLISSDSPFSSRKIRASFAKDAPDSLAHFSTEVNNETESFLGRKFILSVLVRNPSETVFLSLDWEGLAGNSEEVEIPVSENFLLVSLEVEVLSADVTNFRPFFICDENVTTGFIDIYSISLREVFEEISFVEEQEFHLSYQEVLKRTHEFASGFTQKILKGWRLLLSFKYDFLSSSEELDRSKIAEAACLIVFPRNDCAYHVLAQWDGNYSREFVDNKMVGHSGEISIKSIHLFKTKQQDLILSGDAGNISMFEFLSYE